jgi:hypothetical protein
MIWKLFMNLKIGYDFENWVWFWKLGSIWKLNTTLKIGYDFENLVWFWKLGMILKIGYDFENLVLKDTNSETGRRRRRRRRRRFVVPRPGTILSHLVES